MTALFVAFPRQDCKKMRKAIEKPRVKIATTSGLVPAQSITRGSQMENETNLVLNLVGFSLLQRKHITAWLFSVFLSTSEKPAIRRVRNI